MLALIPTTWKIGGIVFLVVLIAGGYFAWAAHERALGKAAVELADAKAVAAAQKKQMENDAKLVKDQKAYIDFIESKGETIKESIRYVQAPCKDDGANDPRLGDTVDWLRRDKTGSIQTSGGPSTQREVPPPRLPAAKR